MKKIVKILGIIALAIIVISAISSKSLDFYTTAAGLIAFSFSIL